MASFWDMLSANGAPFGTLTPQEQAVNPPQTAQNIWALLKAGYGGLVNTAKEAGQASETMRQGGDYNAAPAVNAAMLTMGATPFGMPGAAALGSGPLSFTERMALGKQVAMDVANKGRSIGDYGLGTARRTAPDAPKGTFDDLAARTRQAFKNDTANIIDQYRAATGQQPQGRTDMLLAPGETLGEGDGFTLGAGANDKSAGAAILANQGIRAYHGSPYDFDKFDPSKIGTGEGAQAYGHGLYFAENPKVAQDYRDRLQGLTANPNTDPTNKLGQLALQHFPDEGGGVVVNGIHYRSPALFADAVAKGHIQPSELPPDLYKATADWVKPGKMYEVNINAKPEQFLDWDKPLSEQSAAVRDAYQKITGGIDPAISEQKVRDLSAQMDALAADRDPVTNMMKGEAQWHKLARERDAAWNQWNAAQSGAKAYDSFASASAMRQSPAWNGIAPNTNRRAAVSDILQQNGIPGIKYLDQGSRAVRPPELDPTNGLWRAQGRDANGELIERDFKTKAEASAWSPQSSNYVVFNPDIVEILKKYGLAGLVPAAGALAPPQQQAPVF